MHTSEQLNATLAGRYQIERQIGQGGMATVFLARDLRHHRSVALKVLSSELTAVVGRERFLAEIEVTANLHHPHLLPLFDSGEIGGLLFYVMPYIEGESLRTRLARERQLSIEDAVHITSGVGSALDYAHRHGVIHRDLKPENILMHERDPLVMDFGIALALSKAAGARVTQAGISLGTPQYMSPEQATGDRQIDARSDIYSLGAVAYEMIAGEPPHTGSSVQAIMGKVIAERPQSLHDLRETVPEHVEAAIMRALSKLPADRFASAAEFVSAITGAKSLAVTGIRPRQIAVGGVVRDLPIAPPSEPIVRRRTLGFAAAAIMLAAVGGAIGARSYYKEAPQPSARFVIPSPDSLEFFDTQFRQVALSRDGSRAVLQFQGYPMPLMTRRTGQMHLDPISGTDSARAMVIAPNAKEVLYWFPSDPTGAPPVRLMRIPIDGGVAVKIADSANAISQATWGDDDQVIFRRDDHLVLVSAAGGPERVLARPDTVNGQFSLGWPEMLPGSKAALITILHGRSPSTDSLYLGVVDVEKGTVTDLGVRGLTPHFANGQALYVRADGELFARPFDLRKRVFTGEARVIAKDLSVRGSHGPPDSRGFTDLSVSENGMIMFTDGGPWRLVNGGATGRNSSIIYRTGPEHLTPAWLPTPRVDFQEVRGSPDGTMLALTIGDTLVADHTDIFTYTFSSGQLRQITRDGMSSHPVWSPDGKRIIYRVTNPAAKVMRQFFSVPWNESEPAKPFGAFDGAESIEMPRQGGKYIAIVRGDSGMTDRVTTNSDIFIAPIDSPTVERPFAATGIRERMPRLSPDGKWMAYVGFELASSSGGAAAAGGVVYARPVPGPGGVTKVSLDIGVVPLWSPDGKAIHYFTGGGGSSLARAEVSAVANELRVISTADQFTRPAPATGFSLPTALMTTDILPSDVILYTTTNIPTVPMAPLIISATGVASRAGGATGDRPALAAAQQNPGYNPNLVAIVNWQSTDTKPRTPR